MLLSAALFGALAILAQLAYATGVSVLGLLLGRFTVAGAVLWLIVLVLRRPLPSHRGLLTAVALGAGYSSMALSFAASLKHIEADLADLLLFAYPVLVSLGPPPSAANASTRAAAWRWRPPLPASRWR